MSSLVIVNAQILSVIDKDHVLRALDDKTYWFFNINHKWTCPVSCIVNENLRGCGNYQVLMF